MNIPEILVANGTGAVLVCFLFLLRVRGESKNSVGSELFWRCWRRTFSAQDGSLPSPRTTFTIAVR